MRRRSPHGAVASVPTSRSAGKRRSPNGCCAMSRTSRTASSEERERRLNQSSVSACSSAVCSAGWHIATGRHIPSKSSGLSKQTSTWAVAPELLRNNWTTSGYDCINKCNFRSSHGLTDRVCVSHQHTLHTHTHTRLTALFSRTTQVSRYQKGKTNLDFTEARDSGISWAICKSAPCSRQTTTPAPHHSCFLQAGCPSCRPTNSVKALKA